MTSGPFWCAVCALPKPLPETLCVFCGGSSTTTSRPEVDEDRRNHLLIQERLRTNRR